MLNENDVSRSRAGEMTDTDSVPHPSVSSSHDTSGTRTLPSSSTAPAQPLVSPSGRSAFTTTPQSCGTVSASPLL
ncbi:MAG: hypothetical protein IKD72_09195 [Clostridia bacterium]|nr:hypothetical protein [Clostridia bacterium]